MKQAIMTAPGEIRIQDVAAPTPGPHDVLLRIRRIGACGSDVHVYQGKHPCTSYSVVQGHEYSASVEAVGQGVTGLAPGMKVTSMPQIVCGECAPRLRGDYHICDKLKVEGFQAPGCAQEQWVTPADKIVPLPDRLSYEQGVLAEPVSVAVHATLRAGALAGRRVAVLGAGPIGNLVAQATRATGAKVLITDLSSTGSRSRGSAG
jgi:L-iditol 2-dehydrogenase